MTSFFKTRTLKMELLCAPKGSKQNYQSQHITHLSFENIISLIFISNLIVSFHYFNLHEMSESSLG